MLNPERLVIASECIGDSKWFIEKAVEYAKARVVFGRPIGSNQGIQFPIAEAYTRLVAADGVRWEGVELFDAGADEKSVGQYANISKVSGIRVLLLRWKRGHGCVRRVRDGGRQPCREKVQRDPTVPCRPGLANLVLSFVGHKVLGLPRSY